MWCPLVNKALEMGKSSATGSFHLLLGVVGSTVIMAIGTIVLNMLLPASDVGLYGVALIPATMINFFRDWGINSALTKEIASLRLTGQDEKIHDVIVSGTVFEIISGALLSLVCFAIAMPLAIAVSPDASPQIISDLSIYIQIMSLSVFAGAISAAAGGIFVGYERMKLSSLCQVLQAIVKTALGPLLIVLGFGLLGAVTAAMVSLVVGGVISILIVYYVLFRPLHKCKTGSCSIKKTLKPMLGYGLPLTISTITVGVMPQVIALIMTTFANQGDFNAGNSVGWTMGNYFAAANFAVLLTFVSFPVATALFPVFSKINPTSEPELVRKVFVSSVKYTALLLVPATFMLITLATPLVNTLYPQDGLFQSLFTVEAAPKFPYAPIFLAITASVNLFILVGNISVSTFQAGIGKTMQIMWQSMLSLGIGLPISVFLIYTFYQMGSTGESAALLAVIGGSIGAVIATLPGIIWALVWSYKKYGVKADFGVSSKIFISSIVASVAAYGIITVLSLPYWMLLVVGFIVFLAIYLVLAPLLGAVNLTDIENFRNMFSGLGIVSKVLNLPFRFMSKLCRSNNQNTSKK
jgi:stage V sporulation protein B